jgi:hypothetical protein
MTINAGPVTLPKHAHNIGSLFSLSNPLTNLIWQ